MKTPEEFLTRGKGNFINCTDYDDAIKAMKDYAEQEVAKVISSSPPVIKSVCECPRYHSVNEIKNNTCDECKKDIIKQTVL